MAKDAITVLLVEDNEGDYVIARDVLAGAEQRFELVRARRLDEALRRLDQGGIDVALLDMNVPDAGGLVTFARVHDHAPDVPVVLLTGMNDEAMGLLAVQKGAQDYLVKGKVDQDRLVRALRYAIERKRTEVVLSRYRDRLADLVQERTAALTSANEALGREIAERKRTEEDLRKALAELEEHHRAQSRFVSNVSHELRTPLSSIAYATQNLIKGVVGPLPDRVGAYVQMIAGDCERLTGTVNDVLDFSRIEANRLVLHCAKVPFARFVRRAVDALSIQLEQRHLTRTFTVNGGAGFVSCDPQKTERVILNILQNAIKFTPAGGVIAISIHRHEDDGAYLGLTVKDNGIGIAPEFIGRVTEPFFRVGEHVSGTGLGLAICKEIIRLHRGRLELLSPPPGAAQGTQVSILLPAVEAPTIVVVDDEDQVRTMLGKQLQRLDYRVVCCASGREAGNALQQGPADLLLVDVNMPQMDGVELVLRVRAEHELQHIPILVMTGGTLDGGKSEILSRFAIPVLKKPWGMEELAAAVDVSLAGTP